MNAYPQKTAPVNNYYYPCIPPLLSKQVKSKKARRTPTALLAVFQHFLKSLKKFLKSQHRNIADFFSCKTPPVDKLLDIHRVVCAKPPCLCTALKLSR